MTTPNVEMCLIVITPEPVLSCTFSGRNRRANLKNEFNHVINVLMKQALKKNATEGPLYFSREAWLGNFSHSWNVVDSALINPWFVIRDYGGLCVTVSEFSNGSWTAKRINIFKLIRYFKQARGLYKEISDRDLFVKSEPKARSVEKDRGLFFYSPRKRG